MFSSSKSSSLPRRSTSLSISASSAPKFAEIDDELRDIRRVHTHGQEEDLREALSRMIARVEELSTMLKKAYQVQTDLQTELTLAKSNLQLALANNEMLEDALRRNVPGSSREVGWRRWSEKEQRERELELSRRSVDSAHHPLSDVLSPGNSPPPTPQLPTSAAMATAASQPESRFFKFRFGSSSNAGSPATAASPRFPPMSPRIPGSAPGTQWMGQVHSSHLTSASLPSLVPERDKEIENLTAELEKEKKAHKEADTAKEALEAELETLTQALFEEANKMVAAERIKLAEATDELREAEAEREALRSALKLVRTQQSEPPPTSYSQSEPTSPTATPHDPTATMTHARTMSAVSAMSASSHMAIKSLPSSTAPSSPASMMRLLPDQSTVDPATRHSFAAAMAETISSHERVSGELVEVQSAGSTSKRSSGSRIGTSAESSFEDVQREAIDIEEFHSLASSLEQEKDQDEDNSDYPNSITPSSQLSSSIISTSASTTEEGGPSFLSASQTEFVYVPQRPLAMYFDDDEANGGSPWADVRS